MNKQQQIALQHHCRLAVETIHPRFASVFATHSVVVTVNSGYECLENNYGGPTWHASASPLAGYPVDKKFLARMARLALKRVGDADLGEWEQWSDTGDVFHLKRHLTAEEQSNVGDAIDIRGTAEAITRHAAMKPYLSILPVQYREQIV